jgi:uncharacterized protein YkwD
MSRFASHAPLWRFLVAAAAAVVTLTVWTARASAAVGVPSAESQLMTQLNDARVAAGRPALTRDTALDGLAREWSTQMATTVFAHRSDLATRIAQIEPLRQSWAENIAWRSGAGELSDADVTAVHNGLMASPGHYANIMGDFNRVGVGVYINGRELWVTFDFLKGPALAATPPPPAPPPATTAPPAPGAAAAQAAAPTAQPVGRFRVTRIDARSVRVSGWAVDPDGANPIRVRVQAGRRSRTSLAARHRSDVAAQFPTLGAHHGFSLVAPLRIGSRLCVTALDADVDANRRLGCRRV